MTPTKAAKTIATWLGNSIVERIGDYVVVSTKVRTTSTRASSMETRTKLVAVGEAPGALVWKELVGQWPKKREDLGTWRIFVAIPAKKTRIVRRAA